MLRVSKLTDYATVVMTVLAAAPDPGPVHSAQDLAERAHLELPTVSKLLKQLANAQLVESFRGVNGGYRLARAPSASASPTSSIAMEGPIGVTECSAHICVRARIALRRARELAAHQPTRSRRRCAGVTLAPTCWSSRCRSASCPLRVAIAWRKLMAIRTQGSRRNLAQSPLRRPASSPISKATRAAGSERRHRARDFGAQERAGLDDRMAAQGLSPLADDDAAALGEAR